MIRNLFFFLIPLLVPILILGTLAIMITQHFVKDDINQKNVNLLLQTRDSLDLILNEMDTLSLSFQTSDSIAVRLKAILKSDTYSYDQSLALDLISSFVSAPANARPFIHSIYVYYDNPNNIFLSSTERLVSLNQFYDRGWYESYRKGYPKDSWLEERYINRYGIEKTQVISMYRKFPTSGTSSDGGVIVINFLPGYFQRMLEGLVSRDQIVLIVDQDQQVLVQANMPAQFTDHLDLESLMTTGQLTTIRVNGQQYTVSHLQSGRLGLHYISLIPQDVLYRVPIQLSQITFVLLTFSLLLGIAITFWLTKTNYNALNNIISIIKSAEQGKPIPAAPPAVIDEYGYILQNMIKTFIEQSYLKIQLSERSYRMRFMEMRALQSQINPHFLYNTLENIYWKTMAISGKPNEASEMIEHLGDILKYALNGSQHPTVILDKELRYIEIYLEIQKVRYKDKIDVIWDIDALTLSYAVPKLLLQPIVENCIYHGIKEKEGKNAVKIKTRRGSSILSIYITDNGIGMSKERLKELRGMLESESHTNLQIDDDPFGDRSEHIGLYNTNKRLKLMYGESYALRIRSKYGWGTAVHIRIPIK